MGLTQTKLHHKVLQENWAGICRRVQTEDGKKWARTKNPCGDYPLHLACYGGQTPPIVIRALIAVHPSALYHKNHIGFTPIQLARSNYREGHPFREEVLEYLEAYSAVGHDESRDAANTNNKCIDNNSSQRQIIDSFSSDGANMPGVTYITSSICVVCLERKADHVVVPCGHLCLCGDCAKKVIGSAQPYCPVGRCAFSSIAKVPSLCIAVI